VTFIFFTKNCLFAVTFSSLFPLSTERGANGSYLSLVSNGSASIPGAWDKNRGEEVSISFPVIYDWEGKEALLTHPFFLTMPEIEARVFR